MSIKKYFATKDTAITNAYLSNLQTRGTGSNQGASDVLDVFSIFAQANSASLEASRVLSYFPTTNIVNDRAAGTIPISGSVNFVLKMYNAPHGETLPKNFTLLVSPLSQSFEEGTGLDFESLTDQTRDGVGANWINAGEGAPWATQGGDFLSSSLSQSFDSGVEDLEIDVTSLVESWIDGSTPNNGVAVSLLSNLESGSASYYTKKFFARGTEFFYKRPSIEAKWNSAKTDDRSKWKVISINQALSIKEMTTVVSSIKIYPNPAKDNFTIEINELNNARIKIYNPLGRLIYETSTEKGIIQIDNSGRFKPGIYLVKVIGNNQKTYNQKLVIE